MREILFRGKSIEVLSTWVYGDYWSYKDVTHFIRHPLNYKESCVLDIPVYPETVGQYTGFTDKNGNKIFEGDILDSEYEEFGHTIEVVLWDGFGWATCQSGIDLCDKITDIERFVKSVVIGNVYDNPELLNP